MDLDSRFVLKATSTPWVKKNVNSDDIFVRRAEASNCAHNLADLAPTNEEQLLTPAEE